MKPSAWFKDKCELALFWIVFVAAFAGIAAGYSQIREGQIETAMQLKAVDARLVRVESKLDRLTGWDGAAVK